MKKFFSMVMLFLIATVGMSSCYKSSSTSGTGSPSIKLSPQNDFKMTITCPTDSQFPIAGTCNIYVVSPGHTDCFTAERSTFNSNATTNEYSTTIDIPSTAQSIRVEYTTPNISKSKTFYSTFELSRVRLI